MSIAVTRSFVILIAQRPPDDRRVVRSRKTALRIEIIFRLLKRRVPVDVDEVHAGLVVKVGLKCVALPFYRLDDRFALLGIEHPDGFHRMRNGGDTCRRLFEIARPIDVGVYLIVPKILPRPSAPITGANPY